MSRLPQLLESQAVGTGIRHRYGELHLSPPGTIADSAFGY